MLTVGSLFAGIGGFDLGLERAGMRTVWFCEQDPFCQRVLAKHWPGVPCHSDVRALVADAGDERARGHRTSGTRVGDAVGGRGNSADAAPATPQPSTGDAGGSVPVPVPYVDVLCGGFPCQDISVAGRGAGIDGARSGLWGEYARLVRELRPRYVIVENVPALLARGLGRVLGDLAACGYDAEWDCIPASAVGAPHRRDRIWIVAYPAGEGLEGLGTDAGEPQEPEPRDSGVGDADPERWDGRPGELGPRRRGEPADAGWWAVEPDVGRVAHGVPARVDRLRALGNSLVPQIAQLIGERIVAWEQAAGEDDAQ